MTSSLQGNAREVQPPPPLELIMPRKQQRKTLNRSAHMGESSAKIGKKETPENWKEKEGKPLWKSISMFSPKFKGKAP